MQSTVVKVCVSNNDIVVPGEIICVVEAMKMEQPVVTSIGGLVSQLDVAQGDNLSSGALIAVIVAE